MNRSAHTATSPRSERPSIEQVRRSAVGTFDEAFFRIVCRLFPPEFTFGAGVLLSTYDPE